MASRLDRAQLRVRPLSERGNFLDINKIGIHPEDSAPPVSERVAAQIAKTAERIIAARRNDKPVVLTYGAHLIKNGLAPVVNRLIEGGWITHVATNGAGSIHDWEFAFQGLSSEDVRQNTAQGQFGIWDETGRWLNLAVAAGGLDGLGYGWSVGKMIAEDGLTFPSQQDLRTRIIEMASAGKVDESAGAIADALHLLTSRAVPEGRLEVIHPFKSLSVQHAAYKSGVPFTVHPGIGYDIIYTHPTNCGGIIGRASVWDFLAYARSISQLSGGVHVCVGTAIMGPMIFEKSLSMANNLALQRDGKPLSDYYLAVVDIQEGGDWDWSAGEPPKEHPAYYLRFCKSFYRMGGTLDYICTDNRAFLLGLYHTLHDGQNITTCH